MMRSFSEPLAVETVDDPICGDDGVVVGGPRRPACVAATGTRWSGHRPPGRRRSPTSAATSSAEWWRRSAPPCADGRSAIASPCRSCCGCGRVRASAAAGEHAGVRAARLPARVHRTGARSPSTSRSPRADLNLVAVPGRPARRRPRPLRLGCRFMPPPGPRRHVHVGRVGAGRVGRRARLRRRRARGGA